MAVIDNQFTRVKVKNYELSLIVDREAFNLRSTKYLKTWFIVGASSIRDHFVIDRLSTLGDGKRKMFWRQNRETSFPGARTCGLVLIVHDEVGYSRSRESVVFRTEYTGAANR